MSLLPLQVHSSWNDFLTPEIINMLNDIEQALEGDFSPDRDKVLRFLSTGIDMLKVVILGQDPYPEKGAATGRAFEVGTLKSWDMPFKQVSLKNMIRLIYKSQTGIERYEDIPTYSRIVEKIKAGSFQIAYPSDLFDQLEKQGVLFLNTCFTVCPGKPLSHRHLWQPFTDALVPWLSQRNKDLIWFLWGKNAQSYKPQILSGNFYESRHPMMCSKNYADDFLKSDCIQKTMKIINWTGV